MSNDVADSHTAPAARERLRAAFWIWTGVGMVLCLLSWRAGTPGPIAAAGAALALAPALAGVSLAHRWGESWAQALCMIAFTAFAAAAAAASGGAASPAAVAFTIAPALALWSRAKDSVADATLMSGFGFAIAAVASGFAPGRPGEVELLATLLGAASIVFAGGLAAAAPRDGGLRSLLLDAVPSVVLDRQGRILAATSAARQILGLSSSPAGAVLTDSLAGQAPPADRTALADMIEAARRRGAARLSLRVGGERGRPRVVEAAARPAGDGVALTVLDASAWAEAAEQKEAELRAAVGESERKSGQIAELSHELRTPLTHILGFAELMEREVFGPMPERYSAYAGLIRTSGAHLLSLVNDLLDLSRIEAGRHDLEFERFDARAVAQEVIEMSSGSAQLKEIALSLAVPETAVMVDADPQALRQMLLNIVGNAVKFTPHGGSVAVAMHAQGPMLLVETSDTGPGIPEEERALLGQRYVRGARAHGVVGAGLGLAIVRALADLHGGGLSFDEAEGGGALVRLSLPVCAQA